MRQLSEILQARVLSGILVCGFAVPALAQRGGDDDNRRGDRGVQRERQQARPQGDRRMRMEPAGWIRVGVDYDQDGRFEEVDTIYAFDLENARKQSQGRKERSRRGSRMQQEQVRGTVLRTRQAKFRSHEGTFLVAEIKTEDGNRRLVNMGPKDKFDDVRFADAGQIRVLGHQGSINGKDALIAEQVRIDGQTIRVQPGERRDPQWRREQRERESRDRRFFDRGERDRRLLDRGDREERDRRLLDRGDREERDRRLLDRGDREERDRRLLDRGDREREDREGRLLDRDQREARREGREERREDRTEGRQERREELRELLEEEREERGEREEREGDREDKEGQPSDR